MILREGLDSLVPTTDVADTDELSRPCYLRTWRATCNESNRFIAIARAGGSSGGSKEINGLSPLLRTESNKSSRLRSDFAGEAAGGSCSGKKRQRVKYSISRREIKEDFMTMIGHRPPRRPNKRANLVKKIWM